MIGPNEHVTESGLRHALRRASQKFDWLAEHHVSSDYAKQVCKELAHEMWNIQSGAQSAPREPTEDQRSVGHSIRQYLLKKQPIPEALALSAIAYLAPPMDSSDGPWCDNCGQDEAAHTGPELKCPPDALP